MELVQVGNNGVKQDSSYEALSFARSYQLEALEKAIEQNTIVFLETGAGKTLIAIMLLRRYTHLLQKPSPFIAVFLVPTVVLVSQQAEAVKMHTDLKVGKYWGEMGVDYWDEVTWKQQQFEYEVLVMTPAILLDALRHSFLKMELIKVLIFDECHNAKGRHPYACIMTEFYHEQLKSSNSQLPRIFGMTASPVKSKGSTSGSYWSHINELETLMNSKVYTCANESVLAKYIPSSATMLKFYEHKDIPYTLFQCLENDLKRMMDKHILSLSNSNLSELAMESAMKRLSKLYGVFCFCLSELGVWLALKAAEFLSCEGTDTFSWGKLDICSETICRDFILDARKVIANHIPTEWSICHDEEADVDAGYLTTKVFCLIESLAEYRHLEDLRCIIFVERVITAIVLKQLLSELYPKLIGWRTEYTAGNNSALQPQSRKSQNKIVEDFRKGKVNIIVATSILEEGLDVQSCNLVIRFDLSATVCSFIQSRGRARMQNSHFLLLVRSGDHATISKVERYIASGDVMREESLRNASFPCAALNSELCKELFYRVETTGAIVTLSSSVSLIYFYCSRLPSDGYFKPSPRCVVNQESKTCTVYFPKSCPIQSVTVEGNNKMLKQVACLEACRQLHLIGALTDNLVPDIVVEEADAPHIGYNYVEEQVKYFPSELISRCDNDSDKDYHCYLIELQRMFDYDIHLTDIVLAVSTKLEFDDSNLTFSLEADRGDINVCIRYVGDVHLAFKEVLLCQRFQFTLCRVLLDHNLVKLKEVLDAFQSKNDFPVFDYLLLPSVGLHKKPAIDWKCVVSVLFPYNNKQDNEANCSVSKRHHRVNTKNDSICSCLVEHSLVCTPHNGKLYCITSALHDLNGNSLLTLKDGEEITYKNYYQKRHGIDLQFEKQPLFSGRQVFPVRNCLLKSRQFKEKEPSNAIVELPPELFFIIMSPISIETFYSFSFMPSVMHRIESWLIAANLKKILVEHCTLNIGIPTTKVLEAITTKKCQEKFHLESLETLGDSFLKYAASQYLFKTHQNQHEGILSTRREKIICNATLCKLGCDRNLPGFIRNEPFDPKTWSVPGDLSGKFALAEEFLAGKTKIYSAGTRHMKSKAVADAVEALIGAYLSNGGEAAALSFMDWLGIKVDLTGIPYERDFAVDPGKLLDIRHLENLFNYTFHDPSLLVEALTHGSYMLPEIPRCYQRLEFLGDAVLDYLITVHLYLKHPGLSPGMLTDLRSASVNNDCYALSALKIGLHKHILHCSQELHRHISATLSDFEELSSESTFGWESETTFPKVLGDVIESIAGAIYVDSGYNKEIVFQSIRPILEPLITPETIRFHPVKELTELCQKLHFNLQKAVDVDDNGVRSIAVTVEANGAVFRETRTAADKKMAEKLASKAVLKALKESFDNPNSSSV